MKIIKNKVFISIIAIILIIGLSVIVIIKERNDTENRKNNEKYTEITQKLTGKGYGVSIDDGFIIIKDTKKEVFDKTRIAADSTNIGWIEIKTSIDIYNTTLRYWPEKKEYTAFTELKDKTNSNDTCMISNRKENDSPDSCSNEQLEIAKSIKNKFKEFLKEVNVNEKDFVKWCKWYYAKNEEND